MTRFEMNEQFANNIEIERIKLNLTQKQMADKLDLSLSAYKRIITCSTDKIDLYVIYKLYELTGKLAYEFTSVTDPFLELKKKIMGLSPSQMSYINALIDFEKSFSSAHEDFEDYVTVYIPTGNMEDGMIYDSANVEKINIADYRKKYGSQIGCGLRITSTHLQPVYNIGDTLLIANKSIRDGDTGIFINCEDGRLYLRKYYQTMPCKLEPINGYGETFYIDSTKQEDMDKWIRFGRVLAKIH